MKLVKAFIHHIRAPVVVEALADAGFAVFAQALR